MKVFIGHLAKCMNSTAFQFDLTDQDEYPVVKLENVRLKEPTQKYSPTLLLLNKTENSYKYAEGYSQMYIPEWGYYFIDDVTYETDDLIAFHCTRDVLATGHEYIKDNYFYINFCSSTEEKVNPKLGLLDDPRFGPDVFAYAAQTNFLDHDFDGKNLLWQDKYIAANPAEGTVALSTISSGAGALTFFLTLEQFLTVVGELSNFGTAIQTMDQLVEQYLYGTNWRDCMLGAVLLPLKKKFIDDRFADTQTQKNTVHAGSITDLLGDGTQVYYTKSPSIWWAKTVKYDIDWISMLKNPMYKWLRGPKYSKITFEYPGGSIDLSSEANVDRDDMFIMETFNIVTGDYLIRFYAAEGQGDLETNEGNCLGAARIDMAVDLFDMMTHIDPLTNIKDKISKTFSAAANVAKAAAGIGLSQGTALSAAESNFAKGSHVNSKGQSTIVDDYTNMLSEKQQIRKSATAETLRLSTGISGPFTTLNSQPVGTTYSVGDGLTSFYRAGGSQDWLKNQCRIVVSTTLPAAFYEEWSKTLVVESTPMTDTKYYWFGQQFGFPLLQYIDLWDFKTDKEFDNQYIQCTGANCGFSGFLYGREPQSKHFTLTRYELAELNTQLNSNGVKLDALYSDSWGTDPI